MEGTSTSCSGGKECTQRSAEDSPQGTDGKRPQFGSRYLTKDADVFSHNAWDDVQLTPEQEAEAQRLVQFHRDHPVPEDERDKYHEDPSSFWDKFYSTHDNRFFKDRKWLFTEFPELVRPCDEWPTADAAPGEQHCSSQPRDTQQLEKQTQQDEGKGEGDARQHGQQQGQQENDAGASQHGGETEAEDVDDDAVVPDRWNASSRSRVRILEVGCGAGNTVFPVLQQNPDEHVFVYACDYAPTAVQIVQNHELYNPQRCNAFVCDISKGRLGLPPNSLDMVILIFVLSALHPEEMARAVTALVRCLKPGGHLVLRDYGRHDLAQLRLKKGRYLQENFYIRGDGTRVYFYDQDEVRQLMERHGLQEKQNKYDRRLIVNRAKRVAMQRVWLQCKYRKPDGTEGSSADDDDDDEPVKDDRCE